jgi:hypothetical protein
VQEAEAKVQRRSKKVALSSKILIALGIVGVICSFAHGSKARDMAYRIVNGDKPWGPPPTREEERAMGTQVVTRDELLVYDTLKTMSYLMFLMSILVIGMGKCGLRIVWREKSKVGHRVLKKSFIIFALVGLMGIAVHYNGGKVQEIKKQYNKHDDQEQMQDMNEPTDKFEMFFKVNHACNYKYANECDADSACTWCTSIAK